MIHVENLVKEYTVNNTQPGFKGAVKSLFSKQLEKKVALNGISFDIPKGGIVGFLGQNGAGKSTTIKIMTGILTPTNGKCSVNGIIPYKNRKINAYDIGVVFGQRTQLWWDLPITETFSILKKIYKINESDFKKRLDLLSEILDLDDFMNKSVRTLSLGQRMRADIAAALIHNPKVLYLDEPTIGLDIVVKDKVRNAIKNFNNEYKTTIILTTHDMSEVEELCSRIIVIDKGSLIYDGSIDKLKGMYGNTRTLELSVKDDLLFDKIKINNKLNISQEDLVIMKENKKIYLTHNREKVTTIQLINAILEEIEVKDINIIDMPVGEVIKQIYLGKSIEKDTII